MCAKNLGTIGPTSTLINFYASLLTKSNMAAVSHFGKVFFLFLTPILLMILVHRTLFLCYFHHWGNFSCLLTFQIQYGGRRPYWKSHLLCSLLHFHVQYCYYILLLILACRIHFGCY